MKVEPYEHLPPDITSSMFSNNAQRVRCAAMYRFLRLSGYPPEELRLRYLVTPGNQITNVEVIPQSLCVSWTPRQKELAAGEKFARYAPTPINGGSGFSGEGPGSEVRSLDPPSGPVH